MANVIQIEHLHQLWAVSHFESKSLSTAQMLFPFSDFSVHYFILTIQIGPHKTKVSPHEKVVVSSFDFVRCPMHFVWP
jgi:hypothetical protein